MPSVFLITNISTYLLYYKDSVASEFLCHKFPRRSTFCIEILSVYLKITNSIEMVRISQKRAQKKY